MYATKRGSNVSDGLWGIIMCQYCFVDYNKCITVVGAVISTGGYVCVETGDRWEISIRSAQSCCELKTLLRNKVH